MRLNNALIRSLTAAVTLLAASPPANAEKMTGAQRACVQRALKNRAVDTDAVRQCLTPAEAGGDPDKVKKVLAPDSLEARSLFVTLEARFATKPAHYERAKGVTFTDVKKSLEARPDLLWSLGRMEATGGAPDVVAVEGNMFVFADVSEETPEGRRNLDYDQAKAMADEMGVKMMDEGTYRTLNVDHETWSWLLTDAKIRAAGGALNGTRNRDGVVVLVVRVWADRRGPHGGVRGLLRVPKKF